MSMTINPSAHALRFGQVPAKLERLHDGITVAPASDEYTPVLLEIIDNFEETAKLRAEGKQAGRTVEPQFHSFDRTIQRGVTVFITKYLMDKNYGAIETLYQAIKDKPTFTLDARDPIYAALAKAFKRIKQPAAQ